MNKALFCLIIVLFGTSAYAVQPRKSILSCPLADGTKISLLAEPTAEGQRLLLELDHKIETAFSDMPDSDFLGEVALAKCAQSSLVFAINYGSPYLKGAVIRKNPATYKIERINFAEKSLPSYLYLGRTRMRLLIPNIGNEVSTKFVVYDYLSEKGQPDETTGVDAVPSKRGFKVMQLK